MMREVEFQLLSRDPALAVAQLEYAADVRHCRAPGCDNMWIGGHGNRQYCSEECRMRAHKAKGESDEGRTE